jgi:hypothetical protein
MRYRTRSFVSMFIAATLFAAGCGGPKANEPTESVSGKVLLEGQPVAGTVYFTGSDGREIPAAINVEGKYTVANPPKGEGKFTVKSNLPAAPAGAPQPKAGSEVAAPEGVVGKVPPAKYALPGHAIAYNYAGGKQTFDIELKP